MLMSQFVRGITAAAVVVSGICGWSWPRLASGVETSCSDWQDTGPKTVFTIHDSSKCDAVDSGAWVLGGTLEVRFEGTVEPHEGSEFILYGGGVTGLKGEFERVVLPDGWLYDLKYDHDQPAVVLRNLKPDRAPAFPGAEGFGKYTLGGRGGRVIEVTNLNDSGPGSFRMACEATGPRIIVFRVSGTIALASKLVIRHPFITIAGQSAPGDGICISDHQVKFEADHVIVRYLRFRPGDAQGVEHDGFGGNGDHVIIDHCSVSWSVDEALSINKASNLTVQWCMVTESLYDSVHKKGRHGYGGLWGGRGGSWHHNLLAHHSSRNPRASGNENSGLLDVRNNVIYNWGFNSAYGGERWPRNWINNYYKSGPATREDVRHRIFIQSDSLGKMFAAGNVVEGFPEISADNWAGGIEYSEKSGASEKTLRVFQPFQVAPISTQTAIEALECVLTDAGASLSRDSVDARIAEEVRAGRATYGETWGGGGKGIIDSQTAVGGWPELKSTPAPLDTDHDGMPDDWEETCNLDARNREDGAADRDRDGYTNVEEYLNALVDPRRDRAID